MTPRVALFVTSLADQLWPAVGSASVEVLRRVGCEVDFDPRQTCCGQPAFNTGYRADARRVARVLLDVYADAEHDAVVVPSGSCAAMIHHLHELFEPDDPHHRAARSLAARMFELSSFLVDELGVDDVGGAFDGRVTWHDSCHGLRELGIREAPRRLLRNVRGLELVESPTADSCCGFGGTFSVKFPEISVAMLDDKLDGFADLRVDAIAACDVSCLMQIGGRLARRGSPIRTLHLAEILAADR